MAVKQLATMLYVRTGVVLTTLVALFVTEQVWP